MICQRSFLSYVCIKNTIRSNPSLSESRTWIDQNSLKIPPGMSRPMTQNNRLGNVVIYFIPVDVVKPQALIQVFPVSTMPASITPNTLKKKDFDKSKPRGSWQKWEVHHERQPGICFLVTSFLFIYKGSSNNSIFFFQATRVPLFYKGRSCPKAIFLRRP